MPLIHPSRIAAEAATRSARRPVNNPTHTSECVPMLPPKQDGILTCHRVSTHENDVHSPRSQARMREQRAHISNLFRLHNYENKNTYTPKNRAQKTCETVKPPSSLVPSFPRSLVPSFPAPCSLLLVPRNQPGSPQPPHLLKTGPKITYKTRRDAEFSPKFT
jgi:hypothetical protein